jgi:hypothetical protein
MMKPFWYKQLQRTDGTYKIGLSVHACCEGGRQTIYVHCYTIYLPVALQMSPNLDAVSLHLRSSFHMLLLD